MTTSHTIVNKILPLFAKGLCCLVLFFEPCFLLPQSALSGMSGSDARAYAQSGRGPTASGAQSVAQAKAVPAGGSVRSGPTPQGGSDTALPPTHRTVIHTEAYKKREGFGPHINFKITPPEKRGRKGRVLVEVYNYSKVNLAVVNFWLMLSNQWGDLIEVQINCDDIPAGWSALKWVKIPGDKPIPEITSVQIKNMKVFNDQGRETKLRYFTDLIKQ